MKARLLLIPGILLAALSCAVPQGEPTTEPSTPPDETTSTEANGAQQPAPVFGQGPPPLPEGLPIVTTESGLQYAVLQPGGGGSPQPGQEVEVHYTGWLESNGARFDSSVDRGQPLRFVIGKGKVIKGWDEGVMDMKLNEKRRLVVPAELAYGDKGAGQTIPPGATLVFDVELLAIH